MGFLRLSLPTEYAKRTGLLPNKYQPPTACFSSWSDRDGSVGLEELTQMAVSSILLHSCSLCIASMLPTLMRQYTIIKLPEKTSTENQESTLAIYAKILELGGLYSGKETLSCHNIS